MDRQVIPDRKRCASCGKVKPLGAFRMLPGRRAGGLPGPHSWCVICERIGLSLRRETPEYHAWREAYFARPEVAERRREADRKYKSLRAAEILRRAKTPRYRLLSGRRAAVSRLRRATSDEGRARILATIAMYDREIARLEEATS